MKNDGFGVIKYDRMRESWGGESMGMRTAIENKRHVTCVCCAALRDSDCRAWVLFCVDMCGAYTRTSFVRGYTAILRKEKGVCVLVLCGAYMRGLECVWMCWSPATARF